MNVLVTGGTGYLGRAVVTALAARGHQLVVFARSASRSGLPGTLIDGDIDAAKNFARRAQAKLKVGSPGWLKADDIINYESPTASTN